MFKLTKYTFEPKTAEIFTKVSDPVDGPRPFMLKPAPHCGKPQTLSISRIHGSG